MNESLFIPALLVLAVLSCVRAHVNVYDAFARGAREGLETVISIAPYLCAILAAVSLLRQAGLIEAAQSVLAPAFERAGIPIQSAGVILLRPVSGSAALAAVADVMREAGADSRAARLACVVSGASETVFFTGSLYLGATGVKRARYVIPVSLLAYAVGVLAAAYLV